MDQKKTALTFPDRYGFLFFSFAMLILSYYLLPHYGIVGDTLKNLNEGMINLNYLLWGKPPTDKQMLDLVFQIHGAFFFMASAASKYIFCDVLRWIGPSPALHILLPISVFLFMNAFFAFLRRNVDTPTAWITCLALWTYPRFWGLTFHDIKDVPLFIFFSLTVFYLYQWTSSHWKMHRFLYGAAVTLGIGIANKVYVLLAPVIVFIWWAVLWVLDRQRPAASKTLPPVQSPQMHRRIWVHSALCCGITLLLAAVFFMPAFFAIPDKTGFLAAKTAVVKNNLFSVFSRGWNVYPWLQIACVTPVLSLIAAMAGLWDTVTRRLTKPFDLLMMVWLFTVLFVFCTPWTVVYAGVRIFLPFAVPFCYFISAGILRGAELTARFLPARQERLAWALAGMVMGAQVWGIAEMHPYESMFFNAAVGGLKGAQQKNIPDAGDYWCFFYLESSRLINEKLPRGGVIFTPTGGGFRMLDHYGIRPDIRYDFVRKTPLPSGSFLLHVVDNKTLKKDFAGVFHHEVEQEAARMIKLHEVKRQGGKIFSVHYKP